MSCKQNKIAKAHDANSSGHVDHQAAACGELVFHLRLRGRGGIPDAVRKRSIFTIGRTRGYSESWY